MPGLQQHAMLLRIPAELRNQIYELIAQTSKTVIVLAPNSCLAIPSALSFVCRQCRQEYTPVYESLSMAYATEIVVYSNNFDLVSLTHALQDVPAPRPDVVRTLTLNINLTNDLQRIDLETFVKELAEPAVPPKTAAAIKYQVTFDPEAFELVTWRCQFARQAKHNRFHSSDAEQRSFEKIYWAFAESAEKADGVTVKQFASGCWKSPGGGFYFV